MWLIPLWKLVSRVFLFLLIPEDSVPKRCVFLCLDFIDECLQLIICKIPLLAFATHGLFLLLIMRRGKSHPDCNNLHIYLRAWRGRRRHSNMSTYFPADWDVSSKCVCIPAYIHLHFLYIFGFEHVWGFSMKSTKIFVHETPSLCQRVAEKGWTKLNVTL